MGRQTENTRQSVLPLCSARSPATHMQCNGGRAHHQNTSPVHTRCCHRQRGSHTRTSPRSFRHEQRHDTDEPAQSPTKPTSTPPPPVITSTKVKELARVEVHLLFTKGSGVPLPHHARDARAAVSATPPERQAAGKQSATKSMPPRVAKTTKTTQHHLVVDQKTGRAKMSCGLELTWAWTVMGTLQ